MKKLLITGGSGNLGRPLSALACQQWETTSTYFHNPAVGGGTGVQIDLRDREATLRLADRLQPDLIIHAATSDRSQDMPRAIRLAAAHISEAAQAQGIPLIAMSSDMIFDGKAAPYSEETPPTPVTPYGEAKADSEEIILSGCTQSLIVRTSLIYDLTPDNRQMRWMLDTIAEGKRVPLFVDELRQPVWAWNLAEALLELAGLDLRGILNIAGGEEISRWDYGRALLQAMGHNPDEVTTPVRAEVVVPQRPRNCTLNLMSARRHLKTPLLTVQEALEKATTQDS